MLTRTDDASNTLFSERYEQTYHSTFGALTESIHVFLQGSGVLARLKAGQPTRVLEIGLGLGLNCLLTIDCATTHKSRLHYTGIEHDPISASQLQALCYQDWLSTPELVDSLAKLFSEPGPSRQLSDMTSAELLVEDATSEQLLDSLLCKPRYNAIFLDAFSPEHNPECWTTDFFKRLHALLCSDGLLASYCVKGTVRRNLQAAGFVVEKYPGPAGKREVLRAFAR